MKIVHIIWSVMLVASLSIARATVVTPEELAQKDAWVKERLVRVQSETSPSGLVVLANHDPVTKNAHGSRPLTIADREYNRGLYCHAVSKVIVRLPSPGKTFTAIVGVDSNDQTRPGRGSVIF